MHVQAVPAGDDIPVPAPFPSGVSSEDALGVTVQGAEAGSANYQSISQVQASSWPAGSSRRILFASPRLVSCALQNGDFRQGSKGWTLQGGAVESASSSGGASAPLKMGAGSYIWQPLWTGVRHMPLFLTSRLNSPVADSEEGSNICADHAAHGVCCGGARLGGRRERARWGDFLRWARHQAVLRQRAAGVQQRERCERVLCRAAGRPLCGAVGGQVVRRGTASGENSSGVARCSLFLAAMQAHLAGNAGVHTAGGAAAGPAARWAAVRGLHCTMAGPVCQRTWDGTS